MPARDLGVDPGIWQRNENKTLGVMTLRDKSQDTVLDAIALLVGKLANRTPSFVYGIRKWVKRGGLPTEKQLQCLNDNLEKAGLKRISVMVQQRGKYKHRAQVAREQSCEALAAVQQSRPLLPPGRSK